MQLARHATLLADHSKFTRSAPVRITEIAAFNAFVTDAAPPTRIATACAQSNCEIVIA